MKLQNDQTGQVENFCIDKDKICSCDRAFVYDSLTQLQEAGWEDYKEDKYYWYIDDMGVSSICSKHHDKTAKRKAFGNYFETKEEAKKAVEKLKAWKRLKDKGLTFCAWKITDDGCSVDVETTLDAEVVRCEQKFITDDLNLLFGGKE